MGKQTQRQKAKKAQAAAAAEAPSPTTLCCLPYCDEAGENLECGHPLCGMDFLKLTRFVSQLKKFTITCPMCRKWMLLNDKQVTEAMNKHLPFKSAVFSCGCVEKGCTRSFTASLKACKRHKKHSCEVCGSTMTVQACDDSESDSENNLEVDPEWPRWTVPGWGVADEVFEGAMRTMHGMDETLVNHYRTLRRLGRSPGMGFAYDTPGWGVSDTEFEVFMQVLKTRSNLTERDEGETRNARQEGRHPHYAPGQTSRRPGARNPLFTIPMSEAGPMMDRGDRILIPPDQVEDFMRAVSAVRGR